MAETFHMVNVDVTTSDPTVLTAGGGETLVIIGSQVSNMHATTACWLTATVYQSGGSTNGILCSQVNIPVNDSFSPIMGKLVLEAGDYIKMDAQANSSLEATISYLKQT
tara:strand:- start:7512 stop:7838 length:327 start_codon:yes stop_codon:yes gene_type:complete